MNLPPPPPQPPSRRRPRRGLVLAVVAGAIVLVVAVGQFNGDEPVSTESAGGGSPSSVTGTSTTGSSPETGESTESVTPAAQEPETNASVTRVIDGDTIEVRYRGRILDVRLIGVDTPETVAPGEPVECYGKAASRFTEQTLDGERVLLEFDVEKTDRFGRTLAYVWLDDELFNETLVARGFAQVSTFPPNVKYVGRLVDAQREARHADRGLWGLCEVLSGLTGADDGDEGGNCDPSYPDVCIPPFPPDLDCGDISFSYFRVTGSDPHGFDGDKDGIGCES